MKFYKDERTEIDNIDNMKLYLDSLSEYNRVQTPRTNKLDGRLALGCPHKLIYNTTDEYIQYYNISNLVNFGCGIGIEKQLQQRIEKSQPNVLSNVKFHFRPLNNMPYISGEIDIIINDNIGELRAIEVKTGKKIPKKLYDSYFEQAALYSMTSGLPISVYFIGIENKDTEVFNIDLDNDLKRKLYRKLFYNIRCVSSGKLPDKKYTSDCFFCDHKAKCSVFKLPLSEFDSSKIISKDDENLIDLLIANEESRKRKLLNDSAKQKKLKYNKAITL